MRATVIAEEVNVPYQPGLTTCYYFLFPKLKRPMSGRKFATIEEIEEQKELKAIHKVYM